MTTGWFSLPVSEVVKAATSRNALTHLCVCTGADRRQIRVDGRVERLPRLDGSDFLARPRQANTHCQQPPIRCASIHRGVQSANRGQRVINIGIDSGSILLGRVSACSSYIETWQGRRDRIHERVAYERIDGGWTKQLLEP